MANTLNLINRFIGLGPNRRILQALGKQPSFKTWLNYLSRSGGVFDSFDKAEQARRRHHPATYGHLNHDLISANFKISSQLRCSDYPVLFWLNQIAKDAPLRLFDFGGGQGQAFVAMSSLLGESNIERWIVNDLPEVVHGASALAFPNGPPESVQFSSKLGDGLSSNVFLTAGSLHYWIDPIETLLQKLGTRPAHFIINRSPMRLEGGAYFTVQEGGDWAVPCIVRDLSQLQVEMRLLGYELKDCWVVPEKILHRPWLPEFSSPYQGAYFLLTD